jgi:hypothetical protein
MRSWNSSLFASILYGALAVFAASSAARAADEPEPKALLAQAEAKADAKAQAPAAPNPQSRPIAVRPAPVLADEPRTRDTVLAVSGGLLVVVLAAIGLTITFRSLGADMRGRKRRYRRRTRREPRSA